MHKFAVSLSLGICAIITVWGILKILPGREPVEKEICATLNIINLPENLTISPPAVKYISARVKGPAGLVDQLEGSPLNYTLDLSASEPGLKSIPLAAAHFGLPDTLHITGIKPQAITVRVKTAGRKTVPVYIAVAGKPAAGFAVIDTFAVPGKVTLSGPENLLAGMDRVMTKPITIEGISESIKKETALKLPAGVRATEMKTAIVADIRIEEEIDRRTVAGIPVIARGTGLSAAFSPPEIAMEVEGPTSRLAKLDPAGDITTFVDLEGLKPGVYVRRVSISLPLGITLIKAKPELFTVTIGTAQP